MYICTWQGGIQKMCNKLTHKWGTWLRKYRFDMFSQPWKSMPPYQSVLLIKTLQCGCRTPVQTRMQNGELLHLPLHIVSEFPIYKCGVKFSHKDVGTTKCWALACHTFSVHSWLHSSRHVTCPKLITAFRTDRPSSVEREKAGVIPVTIVHQSQSSPGRSIKSSQQHIQWGQLDLH